MSQGLGQRIPAAAKQLGSYLVRADEMDGRVDLAAFYSRVYVSEQLMTLREQHPDITPFLIEVLDAAEASKRKVLAQQPEDNRTEISDGPGKMQDFVISVFGHVDNEDRMEGAERTQQTALKFMISARWFDVLKQFHGGVLPPDLDEKRKYCMYRAALIQRALKAGLVPEAPEGSTGVDASNPTTGFPPAPPASSQPNVTAGFSYSSNEEIPPKQATIPAQKAPQIGHTTTNATTSAAAAGSFVAAPGGSLPALAPSSAPHVSQKNMAAAKKKCQHAASALDYDDTATAIRLLREALAELGAQ